MDDFYKTLETLEKSSGKQRWNDICNDIVEIYLTSFRTEEHQYKDVELWNLLFEPRVDKVKKKEKLSQVLREIKQSEFFLTAVPIFLQDKFKEGIAVVKKMEIK